LLGLSTQNSNLIVNSPCGDGQFIMATSSSPSPPVSTSTRIGHALAKVLRIKLQYRDELGEEIKRGESVFSIQTADTYVEEEPRSIDWIRQITPNRRQLVRYAHSLFPFTHWITRYNGQWAAGDLVAGKSRSTALYIREN